ncbi:MAG: hypothetical protein KIT84_32385 [Labilithrix sp.]|nr:hypothetical protein [Labilithrix sp.]MCW5815772.1 hypothetical protein [Labilithrix sp.]
MPSTELARVLDPSALDAAAGPHGKMSVELSSARRGEAVELVVPSRLACARCDGGGCDACGRSGALRLSLTEAERTTHFVLPEDARERLRVRLVRPLGDEAGLEQLTIEVRLTPAPPPPPARAFELRPALVAVALALATAIAIAATMR